MGFGKIWGPLFCLLLVFGFFLTRGELNDLQEKTGNLETVAQKTEKTLKEWKDRLFDEPAVLTQATPDANTDEQETTAEPAKQELDFACVFRICNGKIGIFTPEGYQIRPLDVDIRTLPPADIAALEAGIRANSRAEMLERIEDFGG